MSIASTHAVISDKRWYNANERLPRLLINRFWLAHNLVEHLEIADEKIESPPVIVLLPYSCSSKMPMSEESQRAM